ncbi:hypothetical protein LOK49_LG05G03127 [Camellia lanceoleosa]|uniref:Uncharacterized protein n=1 Tax=Camellia lanceoleosa TaxID=1840588 RepID=A0ACC0HH91_9ERIC|nr:hypothetical protein LOK49_LG05G03127 [Camellia lanceoleosa]
MGKSPASRFDLKLFMCVWIDSHCFKKCIEVKAGNLQDATFLNAVAKGEQGFLLAHQLIGRALGISGASVHRYDKPAKMRKQRKMGHITIVGPSMAIVEIELKSMLNEEISDGQTAVLIHELGFMLFCIFCLTVIPRVGIILGSDSDLPVMKDAAKILNMFGVSHEVRIVSVHRTPETMFSYALSARERGIQIIIVGAGGAAHLPG